MGKVYVIRKEEGAGLSPNVAVGPGGPSFILGTSPENVDYGKYDEMSGRTGRYARRLGRLGRAGRIGAGFLGGLRSLYDATSSGQPGALTAAAGGGFSGYYGTQGLEQFAADAGARFGQHRDAKNAPPMPDMNAIGRDRARQERMADYTQGAPTFIHGTAPDATFDSSMFNPVEQQQRAMNNLSRQYQNTGGEYGGNPAPRGMNPPTPTDASKTDMGQAFSEAAPPPSVAPPTTYQSKLPGADPKHPLVREQEKENEAGASSASTDGY